MVLTRDASMDKILSFTVTKMAVNRRVLEAIDQASLVVTSGEPPGGQREHESRLSLAEKSMTSVTASDVYENHRLFWNSCTRVVVKLALYDVLVVSPPKECTNLFRLQTNRSDTRLAGIMVRWSEGYDHPQLMLGGDMTRTPFGVSH